MAIERHEHAFRQGGKFAVDPNDSVEYAFAPSELAVPLFQRLRDNLFVI